MKKLLTELDKKIRSTILEKHELCLKEDSGEVSSKKYIKETQRIDAIMYELNELKIKEIKLRMNKRIKENDEKQQILIQNSKKPFLIKTEPVKVIPIAHEIIIPIIKHKKNKKGLKTKSKFKKRNIKIKTSNKKKIQKKLKIKSKVIYQSKKNIKEKKSGKLKIKKNSKLKVKTNIKKIIPPLKVNKKKSVPLKLLDASYAKLILKALKHPAANTETKVIAIVNEWKPGAHRIDLAKYIKKCYLKLWGFSH
jgi:hypothetical protein